MFKLRSMNCAIDFSLVKPGKWIKNPNVETYLHHRILPGAHLVQDGNCIMVWDESTLVSQKTGRDKNGDKYERCPHPDKSKMIRVPLETFKVASMGKTYLNGFKLI